MTGPALTWPDVEAAAVRGGWQRRGGEWHGPCPRCGGTRRAWVRPGSTTAVVGGCHHCAVTGLDVAADLAGVELGQRRSVTFPKPARRRAQEPARAGGSDADEAERGVLAAAVWSAAGPVLAGALIEWIKSAPALLFDAAMSFISVATLLAIRTPEPPSSMSGGQGLRTLWGELVQGLRVVFGTVTLVLFTGNSAQINLAMRIVLTVYLLYAYNELGLTPAAVGISLSIGSVGGLLGAFATPPLARRIGMGPALALASGFVLAGYLMLPLAKFGYAGPLLATASAVFSFCANMHDIIMNTVRQAIVPQQLQGRVVGVTRTVSRGIHPLGAAIGGLLGAHVGLAPTVLIGSVMGLLSVLWLLPGPVRHVGRHITLEGK